MVVPAAAPHIVSGLRLGAALAFLSLVAAELTGASAGIGYRIQESRQFFRTDRMFVGLAELGLVDTIDISPQGDVAIRLRLTSPFCHMIGFFKTEVQRRVLALPGIIGVSLSADNGLDWSADRIAPAAQARRAEQLQKMESALN